MTKSNGFGLVLYLIFMISSLLSNTLLQLIGTILYILVLISLKKEDSVLILVILSPSIAIVSFPWIGVGLLGVGSFILCVKLQTFRTFPIKYIAPILIVFIITLSRMINGNYYDFILFILVLSTFALCKKIYLDQKFKKKKLIYAYRYGCMLLMFGMVADYLINGGNNGRFRALGDDCNYTAISLFVVFMISLIAYGYSIDLKNNKFYLIISLIFGLLTGSRGFMLAVGVAFAFFGIRGIVKKGDRRIIVLAIIGILIIIGLYFMNFSFAVNLYNATIGRTINYMESYSNGDFMDITSGRFFLWKYYWANKVTNIKEFLFGIGFYNYYLVENGGYGLAAHNMYLSGIIGVGFIGLLAMMSLFLSFFDRVSLGVIKNKAFLAIPIGVFTEYMMLDGLFDQRIIIYMLMAASLANCFISLKKGDRQIS